MAAPSPVVHEPEPRLAPGATALTLEGMAAASKPARFGGSGVQVPTESIEEILGIAPPPHKPSNTATATTATPTASLASSTTTGAASDAASQATATKASDWAAAALAGDDSEEGDGEEGEESDGSGVETAAASSPVEVVADKAADEAAYQARLEQ